MRSCEINKKRVATNSEPFSWESRPSPSHPDPHWKKQAKGCAGTRNAPRVKRRFSPMKHRSRGLLREGTMRMPFRVFGGGVLARERKRAY